MPTPFSAERDMERANRRVNGVGTRESGHQIRESSSLLVDAQSVLSEGEGSMSFKRRVRAGLNRQVSTESLPCDEPAVKASGLVVPSPLPIVTIVCTLDLRCLRVSNECEWLLGKAAAAIEGLRLDTLVHSAERKYLGSLLDRLIAEEPTIKDRISSQWEPHPLVLEYTPASLLARPMLSTTFPRTTMRLHTTMGLFDFFDVRLHLASPFREDRPLIVASLLKYGQDVDHPAISSLDAPPRARLEEDPRWFSSRCFYPRS